MKWLMIGSITLIGGLSQCSIAQTSNISMEVMACVSNLNISSERIEALIIEDKQAYNGLAYGDGKNFDVLREVAINPSSSYRDAAIIGMGRLNSEQAADSLVDIAQGSDRVVAGYALDALATMAAPLAVPRLIKLLDSPSLCNFERGLIITAFRKYPCEDTETAIIQQTGDADLQYVALSSLGVMGTDRSIYILRQFAQGESGNLKSIATHALQQIEGRISRDKATENLKEQSKHHILEQGSGQ